MFNQEENNPSHNMVLNPKWSGTELNSSHVMEHLFYSSYNHQPSKEQAEHRPYLQIQHKANSHLPPSPLNLCERVMSTQSSMGAYIWIVKWCRWTTSSEGGRGAYLWWTSLSPVCVPTASTCSHWDTVGGQGTQQTGTIKDSVSRWDGDSFLHSCLS